MSEVFDSKLESSNAECIETIHNAAYLTCDKMNRSCQRCCHHDQMEFKVAAIQFMVIFGF